MWRQVYLTDILLSWIVWRHHEQKDTCLWGVPTMYSKRNGEMRTILKLPEQAECLRTTYNFMVTLASDSGTNLE